MHRDQGREHPSSSQDQAMLPPTAPLGDASHPKKRKHREEARLWSCPRPAPVCAGVGSCIETEASSGSPRNGGGCTFSLCGRVPGEDSSLTRWKLQLCITGQNVNDWCLSLGGVGGSEIDMFQVPLPGTSLQSYWTYRGCTDVMRSRIWCNGLDAPTFLLYHNYLC